MALPYSVRVSRRMVAGRPGLGCAAAARSRSVSSDVTMASYVASSGRGSPMGGICRVRSFLTTFSQATACAATSLAMIASSDRSAFFEPLSWQSRQYCSTRSRGDATAVRTAWRGPVGRVCGQPQATGRHEAGQPDHRRGPACIQQGHLAE